MSFQLSIFLIIYLVFLLVYLFFTFFNLFHIMRFGFSSFWAYFLTVSYIALTVIILMVSYYYIAQVDWGQTIDLLNESYDSPFF